MEKFITVVLAAVVGGLVAGALGLLIGQAPVFQWEMAGLFVIAEAAVAGAIAGAAGAASGRVAVRAAVGVLLGGAAWLLLSIDTQWPAALIFWGTVTMAAAAGIAGAVAGILGRRSAITLRRRT
jgi:hypothetical protein